MKRLLLTVASLSLIIMATWTIDGQESSQKFGYVGTKKCKMCHSSAKKGGQYKSWESSKHAKAYELLASAEAKKIGADMGIADPQKDAKCLKCHVTAYGVDAKLIGEKFAVEDGVGCETCHGPGEKYIDKDVMADLVNGKVDVAKVGLTHPNEAICKTCHNEGSPTFKGFVFEEKYKLIAHPMPDDFRAEKGYPPKK